MIKATLVTLLMGGETRVFRANNDQIKPFAVAVEAARFYEEKKSEWTVRSRILDGSTHLWMVLHYSYLRWISRGFPMVAVPKLYKIKDRKLNKQIQWS